MIYAHVTGCRFTVRCVYVARLRVFVDFVTFYVYVCVYFNVRSRLRSRRSGRLILRFNFIGCYDFDFTVTLPRLHLRFAVTFVTTVCLHLRLRFTRLFTFTVRLFVTFAFVAPHVYAILVYTGCSDFVPV